MDTRAFIQRVHHIPTHRQVAKTVCRICRGDGVSAAVVAQAVCRDPMVAARVIRAANAADIGLPLKIVSLANAVTFLGVPRVRDLALVGERINNAVPVSGEVFSPGRFWRHSVAVAVIAESIARHFQRYGVIDEQEAYSAGLLHDLGKAALAAYDYSRIAAVEANSRRDQCPVYAAEEPDWSHAALGSLIARRWSFPAELAETIAGHHIPDQRTERAVLLAVVHVADVMVHMVGLSVFPDEVIPPVDEQSLALIRLPPERLRIIAENGIEAVRKIEVEWELDLF